MEDEKISPKRAKEIIFAMFSYIAESVGFSDAWDVMTGVIGLTDNEASDIAEENFEVDNDPSYERIVQILQKYVENDFEGASEASYCGEILRYICGVDREEAEQLGLGYLFDALEK